jgi:hypothetical protein
MPTTLSPTVLNVDWRCEIARSSPYEVNILIPVEGYDPIEFTLTKKCGYAQEKESDPMKGWATFGIISCMYVFLNLVNFFFMSMSIMIVTVDFLKLAFP